MTNSHESKVYTSSQIFERDIAIAKKLSDSSECKSLIAFCSSLHEKYSESLFSISYESYVLQTEIETLFLTLIFFAISYYMIHMFCK